MQKNPDHNTVKPALKALTGLRFFPAVAYFVTLSLALPFFVQRMFAQGQPLAHSGLILFSELTLWQAWTLWVTMTANFSGWSISAEIFFYIVFPLTTMFLARRSKHGLATFVVIVWVVAVGVNITSSVYREVAIAN